MYINKQIFKVLCSNVYWGVIFDYISLKHKLKMRLRNKNKQKTLT